MAASRKTGPQPISKILEGALRQYGLHERFTERAVLSRWAEIVGEDVASHSQAVDIEDGVLILAAEHGAWRQELTMLMPMIMEKFNALCGEGTVREIQWRDRPAHQRNRNFIQRNRKA
ncbi:MAG: putative nucleic acid-binding Zn ribbon protein [Candidatus Krumholzibacteriia bacterium]|jgi:predicted nucleic acid-binding Zn ribbon protein